MSQQLLFETIPCDKYDLISRDELVTLYGGAEKVITYLKSELKRALEESQSFKQKSFFIEEEVLALKKKLFGQSSEKEKFGGEGKPKRKGNGRKGKKKVQLPSKRYPNVPVIERDIDFDHPPQCSCCGKGMQDSGMTEDSEVLTVIPRKYLILKHKRRKYRCGGCHGGLKTAPMAPRICPGSTYSDDMILDVALSKYLDLIPIERYAEMATRGGVKGIPPNSLIQTTHRLSDFVEPVYNKLREEVVSTQVLHADETPHRMLEGSPRKNWYLWGFSSSLSTFFEIQESRSGSVASSILDKSSCRYLMSDVYSGYIKAVKDGNKYREEQGLPLIIKIYCNAHSRRKFKAARDNFPDESRFFLWCYHKIYDLIAREKEDPTLKERLKWKWKNIYMRAMKRMALRLEGSYPGKSSLGKAISYFLNNFEGFSLFSIIDGLPIDNNSQERLLRSHVVGRKTWYGTHSKRGAKTAAILFSLVESCKLNNVNARCYFRDLIVSLHTTGDLFTPQDYAKRIANGMSSEDLSRQ